MTSKSVQRLLLDKRTMHQRLLARQAHHFIRERASWLREPTATGESKKGETSKLSKQEAGEERWLSRSCRDNSALFIECLQALTYYEKIISDALAWSEDMSKLKK